MMKVKCPACQKNHGELAPGDYRCVCTAEFRVESQENPKGKRAGLKSRRIKGQRREGAAAALKDVKAYAATSASRNPGMSYRPDEIAETMDGVSKELSGALWKIVVTLKPTQAVYYDGLTERQLVNRMKKNKESDATIANLKEVLKKEEDKIQAWMDEMQPEGGRKSLQNPFGLASLREHRHNWMPIGPATAQGQKSVCLDRECGLRAMVHNPHQAGQGRITPEGWREHQKHIPIPKGWQLAPSRGPVGMRVAKPRPGMVWIVQSSGAVTAPPTRAQREGKGVAKKYGHKTGRRAPAPTAPGSFEQYTKEEGMEWPRSTPVRASDPSASDVPPESYVSQISSQMGESARKRLSGNNPSKGFIWTAYGINDKPLKGYKQLFAFNRKDAHRRFNHEYGSKVGKGEIAYLVGDTFSQWEANPVEIKKGRAAGQSYGRGSDSQRHPARYDVIRDGEVVGHIVGSSTRQYEKSTWEVYMPYIKVDEPSGMTLQERTVHAKNTGRAPLYTFYPLYSEEGTPFNRAKAFALEYFAQEYFASWAGGYRGYYHLRG